MDSDEDLIEVENVTESEAIEPSLFNETVIFGTDWTTETINLQISKGNIKLDPKFQRRVAWREDRKSQFIESLIFGVPVPQILLAQTSDGKYIVLDGKQRLTAIEEFFSGGLILQNLKLDPSLNGLRYEDLEKDRDSYFNYLSNRPIRTTVIKNCKHDSILHQIFLRVNTGSVSLSPQELRQALHPGEFVYFANKFTGESKPLKLMLGIEEPDYRMRDVDLFVRAMAFYNFSSQYTGSMGAFLDSSCNKLNKSWTLEAGEINRIAEEFNSAISFIQDAFGVDQAFRVWANGKFSRKINRAVVDIMVYYFMTPFNRNIFTELKPELVEAFKFVSEDRDFAKSVSFSTNSSYAVKKRFTLWGNKLLEIADCAQINIPFNHL